MRWTCLGCPEVCLEARDQLRKYEKVQTGCATESTLHCSAFSKDIYLKCAPSYVSDRTISIELAVLEELLRDPILTKVVRVVNLASLSILELLEYDLSQRDINRALAEGVIAFDKSASLPAIPGGLTGVSIPVRGDYYYDFLNSKVRLSNLGIYMLKIIIEGRPSRETDLIKKPK